jgi:hypothetical protein
VAPRRPQSSPRTGATCRARPGSHGVVVVSDVASIPLLCSPPGVPWQRAVAADTHPRGVCSSSWPQLESLIMRRPPDRRSDVPASLSRPRMCRCREVPTAGQHRPDTVTPTGTPKSPLRPKAFVPQVCHHIRSRREVKRARTDDPPRGRTHARITSSPSTLLPRRQWLRAPGLPS